VIRVNSINLYGYTVIIIISWFLARDVFRIGIWQAYIFKIGEGNVDQYENKY